MKKLLETILLSLLIVSIDSRHFKRHINKNFVKNCSNCKNKCSRRSLELNPIEKPEFVVTFVANTKFIANESAPPPEFDPFDRLIQSFFSSFFQGITSGFRSGQNLSQKNDTHVKIASETGTNNNSHSHDNSTNPHCEISLSKKEKEKTFLHDGGTTKCSQKNCLICNSPILSLNSTTNESEENNTTVSGLNSTDGVNISTSTDKLDNKNMEPRHYFLSISGGTEKSTTADVTSDKLNSKSFVQFMLNFLNSQGEQNKSSSVDKLLSKDYIQEKLVKRFKRTDEGNSSSAKVGTNSTAGPDDDTFLNPTEDDDIPIDDSDLSPSRAIVYTKTSYLYTVTIPIFAGFLALIFGMCLCFRPTGHCCRLFLTDPTKAVVQPRVHRNPKKTAGVPARRV